MHRIWLSIACMADEKCMITIDKIQQLEYAEEYVGLESYIQMNYTEVSKVCFHMVHKPIIPDDSIPQKVKQIRDGLRARVPIKSPDFYAQRASELDKTKEKLVGEYGLSNFEDPLTLANVLSNQFNKRDEDYKSRIGTFVVKVKYEEGDGLIGPVNEIGHFEFLPYKGFVLDNRIDAEFGYKPYEEFLNNEKD